MTPHSLDWIGLLVAALAGAGCAQLVGADFDDPRERPIDAGSGAGSSYLKALRPEVDARFGYAVAMDARGLLAVAPFEDEGSLRDTGAAYYFDLTKPSERPIRIPVPGAGAGYGVIPGPLVSRWFPGGDLGGLRVALNDDVVVIGVPSEASANAADPGNADAPFSGAVYVFDRWQLDAAPLEYIKSPRIEAGALFGEAISLSGTRLAVGAPAEDGPAPDSGMVYVYEWVGGAFKPSEPELRPPTLHQADGFGTALEIEGDLLVVGAPGDASNSTGVGGDPYAIDGMSRNAGAAHVYRWSSGRWEHEVYLKPQVAGSSGFFGLDVSVSGGRVAVGAPGPPSRCAGSEASGAGAVEIFTAVGGTWALEQCLAARSRQGLVTFGIVLTLRGNRLVVGAPWDSSGRRDDPGDVSRRFAGAAYVFDTDADGVWKESEYLKAPEIDVDDGFGFAVALSGERLAVGAPQESGGIAWPEPNLADNSTRFAGAVHLLSLSE